LSFPFLAKPAAAAEPPQEDPSPRDYLHDGLHVRLVGGGNFTSFTEEGARRGLVPAAEGPANTLLVGGTPWPGVILGGGVHASFPLTFLKDGTEISADTATVGPFVEWYPDPKKGWHFGALAGAGVVHLATPAASETSSVLGLTAIAGYDWWISPDWSLGINATASASTDASPLDAGSTGVRYGLAPLSASFEVGVAYH
jgi:hypothetical protein